MAKALQKLPNKIIVIFYLTLHIYNNIFLNKPRSRVGWVSDSVTQQNQLKPKDTTMLINLLLLIIALTGFIKFIAEFANALPHYARLSDMPIHYTKFYTWIICLAYLIAYCQTEIPVLWGMR